MIERNIWASARLYIKQHGKHAAARAAQRAVELLAQGDATGAAVFNRIAAAINALQTTEPSGPVH